MADINYYPHLGRVLPNGNLRISTSGRTEDGEIWDGEVEVDPDHPNYVAWLEAINNKEQYLAAMGAERSQAREERRRVAKRKSLGQ